MVPAAGLARFVGGVWSAIIERSHTKETAMPIHDWTRVEAGIFHHFYHAWTGELAKALNRGLLPADYYALAEQIAGGLGPDVLTLQHPTNGLGSPPTPGTAGVALATAPPQVRFRQRAEIDQYAAKAKSVIVRHTSDHRVVAVVEIVSPGNKNSRHALRAFVSKAIELMRGGVHLLIVDLFGPGPRDPQGIHKAIWDEINDNEFVLPADRPLTLAAYVGGPIPEAFVEPTAVRLELMEMPLFLVPDEYVRTPLEATYLAAWEAVPAFWRNVLSGQATG
jgi:hypothetical protein